MRDDENGWDEYKRMVMSDIQDLKDELKLIRETQVHIREDIAGLKALAGFIGGLAGAAASFIGRLF